MLKSILKGAVVASVLTPSIASATGLTDTAEWVGRTFEVHGAGDCIFEYNTAGVMIFDNATTWYVTRAALVEVKTKDVVSLKVETDDKLRLMNNTEVTNVDVDYATFASSESRGRSKVTIIGKDDASSSITNNLIEATNLKKDFSGRTEVQLEIGGIATMAEADVLNIEDATFYKINHTVTCVQ